MRKLFTTGAVALGVLATAGAPSAVADQAGSALLRVTVGSPQAPAGVGTAGAAVAATCTINKITINRFSECEWVAVHVDVVKIVDREPVI
ncbi:hypothetical protein [Streptomyces adonidis]|uniref:hypothetical protein n=1 Tax=Streptomyces adonidis TaxID=3231367 RepID=UPI0034DABBAB